MSYSKKLIKVRKAKQRDYTVADLDKALKENFGNDLEYYDYMVKVAVPDVVNDFNHDISGLYVKYPNVTALLGNELAPLETADEPDCMWYTEKNKYYTISMTDPDAPSRDNPKFREWQHWLVVNIPENKIHEGDHLTEYVGPSPPKGTGLHRYIFLLFEQPGKMNFSEPFKGIDNLADRKNFRTTSFIRKYKLGKPIGGNYFFAKSS